MLAFGAMEAPVQPGAKAAIRNALWRHGLDAVRASPLVGWGGGPHSGFEGPFRGMEAHNTWIDWATRAGILGLGLYVGLLAVVGARLLRARRALPWAALVALLAYGAFHNTMRQPIVWVVWTLVLMGASTAAARATPRATPRDEGLAP